MFIAKGDNTRTKACFFLSQMYMSKTQASMCETLRRVFTKKKISANLRYLSFKKILMNGRILSTV